MKKLILIIFLIFLFSCSVFGENRAFIVLYTNDGHGHILPNKDYKTPGEPKPVIGGSALSASYIQEVRTQAQNNNTPVLLLDAGDIFQGTPEGNTYKGDSIIQIMNVLKYDALTVGNHEFAFGEENLKRLSEKAEFPFLSCNIIKSEGKEIVDYLKPYIIKEINGIKVGIIGVTTPATKIMNFYEHVKEIDFVEPVFYVSKFISILRKKEVDLIIVLSHLGHKDDKIMAECIPQIDIIIGGHDHLILDPPILIGNTIICEAGEHNQRIGYLNLTIDIDNNKVINYDNKMVNLYKELYEPLPEMETLVEKYRDKDKDKVIGYAELTLSKESEGESPLGNWLTDVMRITAKTDIALESGASIRCSLAEGDITKRDLYYISPFDNTLVTLKLTGKQIFNLLETTLANGEIRFQVSGLYMEYNSENSMGKRIINLEINGQKVDYNKYYTIVMNSFVVLSTARYKELKYAKDIKDTKITIYEALVNYTKKNSPVRKPAGKRIVKKLQTSNNNKININNADEKELMVLKGIGHKKAKAIVEYREKYGHFTSIEGIMEVKGIGTGIFRNIKQDICISEN